MRVLITGAGLAAGYGVTTHEDTFAGTLTPQLATQTGRGVVTEIRAAALLPAAAAVQHLGVNGAHTYHVAVFAPCYLEGPFTPGTGIARHGAAIVHHLQTTGSPSLQIVLLGVPRPTGPARVDRAAARAAAATNAALRDLADANPGVLFVDPPTFPSVHDHRPFDRAYYATTGHHIATALNTRSHLSAG